MKNPKSEIRNPKETRNPKPEASRLAGARTFLSAWVTAGDGRADRNVRAPLLALLLLLAATGFMHGQGIPPLINYQGTLTDNLGNPVPAGYYEIQFRIWDHPTLTGAGDYIWGRSFPLHVVTNGLFNILLSDDGSQVLTPGVPQAASISDAFAGPDRFLGLTVTRNPAGQVTSPVEISPRQRLVSAPYAMQAQNAANLQGTTNNGGNFGILGGNVIEFGRGIAGKEQNAGKIGYNTFSSDSLDIIGAGTNVAARKIRLWAQGGVIADGTVTAPAFSGNGTIPVGGIILWSGATVPSGWALCNGNNNTPDLRGRFVLGSGTGNGLTARSVGQAGGEESHVLTRSEMPSHTHGVTDPGHGHNFTAHDSESAGWNGGAFQLTDRVPRFTGAAELLSATTGISIQSNGSDTAHNTMPPFYVLAYIMRVQ